MKKEKCSKFHPGIGPGDADVWARENFLVPPLPPSGLPMCRIIDIKYTLHVSFIEKLWFHLSQSLEKYFKHIQSHNKHIHF